MAENIKQTHHNAEPEVNREYLDLFFSKFMVKDGKIVAALPSEYIKPLITSGKLTVRIKNGSLHNIYSYRNFFINHYTEVADPILILEPQNLNLNNSLPQFL